MLKSRLVRHSDKLLILTANLHDPSVVILINLGKNLKQQGFVDSSFILFW